MLATAAFGSALLKNHAWGGVQWGLLASDVILLLVMLGIALKSRRWWPLFASAFQLLAVLTHSMMMLDHSVGEWAYITAGVIWSYGILFTILVGTVNSWRRRGASKRDLPAS